MALILLLRARRGLPYTGTGSPSHRRISDIAAAPSHLNPLRRLSTRSAAAPYRTASPSMNQAQWRRRFRLSSKDSGQWRLESRGGGYRLGEGVSDNFPSARGLVANKCTVQTPQMPPSHCQAGPTPGHVSRYSAPKRSMTVADTVTRI
jgi:hypothetical protein